MSQILTNSLHCNSRYCFNETPPTAGPNLDYFYPHFIQESANLLSRKFCLYALDTRCSPVPTAYICALAIDAPFHIAYTIEGLHNAVRTYSRMIFKNLLVSFCTARYGEKQQKPLKLSIYFMEGFEISPECVCVDILVTRL